MRRFALWPYFDAVAKHRTIRLMFVPPTLVMIMDCAIEDEARVRQCLLFVRNVVTGAALLDASTQAHLQRLLPPNYHMTQLWATTELSCIATYFYTPASDTAGSVGTFMLNLDAKLVDDDGKEVDPYNVRGELCA